MLIHTGVENYDRKPIIRLSMVVQIESMVIFNETTYKLLTVYFQKRLKYR